TGTMSSGADGSDCKDFKGQPDTALLVGAPDGTTESWTYAYLAECSDATRLYCFGIDASTAGAAPAETRQPAVLSTQRFTGIDGAAAADQVCRDEAAAMHVDGMFQALVAQTGRPLSERFGSTGPFVRPDGVIVATQTDRLLAPINVTLAHEYI